ncbi:MAG: hypothetical protein MI892_05470 [Desulfobacterales bacterium]|nr:hypothetical protein [Desulfobacterales bacterium]
MSLFKSILWVTASCLILCLPISCTTAIKGKQTEPSAIYIRNSSDSYIDSIRITGGEDHDKSKPVGAMSPLPQGVTQVIGRPSNPPKLPRKLMVCWKKEGAHICQMKNIKEILKNIDSVNTALVFDIQPQSRLKIYPEPIK